MVIKTVTLTALCEIQTRTLLNLTSTTTCSCVWDETDMHACYACMLEREETTPDVTLSRDAAVTTQLASITEEGTHDHCRSGDGIVLFFEGDMLTKRDM